MYKKIDGENERFLMLYLIVVLHSIFNEHTKVFVRVGRVVG